MKYIIPSITSHGSGEEGGGSASGSSSSSQQTEHSELVQLSSAFKQGVTDSKEPTPVPAAEAVIGMLYLHWIGLGIGGY